MTERIQLNLRFDRHKDLYEAVKAEAKQQDTSINDFVVKALKMALGQEVRETAISANPEVLEEVEARLEARLASRLAELVNERVGQVIALQAESTLGELVA